jgi:voltage-gated potassium channel
VNTPYTLRHFTRAIAAFSVALLAGTAAFAAFLDESGLQAFLPVDHHPVADGIDTKPHGTGGIIATILLVLAGMAIYGYLASAIVELIAHGVLTGTMAERRRRRVIQGMRRPLHRLRLRPRRPRGRPPSSEPRRPVRRPRLQPEVLEIAREQNVPYIDGQRHEGRGPRGRGLEQARGLVACSDSDVDNLYIVVSARAERPTCQIVARASTEDAATKMLRAGRDRVVQPYSQLDQEIAKLMLMPWSRVPRHRLAARRPDLRFEEIEITSAARRRAGRSARPGPARDGRPHRALKKADGTFDTTPDPDAELNVGDVLISVGTKDELRKLEEMFAPRQAVAG